MSISSAKDSHKKNKEKKSFVPFAEGKVFGQAFFTLS